jgi:hypothetical protein
MQRGAKAKTATAAPRGGAYYVYARKEFPERGARGSLSGLLISLG